MSHDESDSEPRTKKVRRKRRTTVAMVCLLLSVPLILWWQWVYMPGQSSSTFLRNSKLDPIAATLKADVETLYGFGERRIGSTPHRYSLTASRKWLQHEMEAIGPTSLESFEVDGIECINLSLDVAGTLESRGLLVVGAHYDSAHGTAGANDNASGVAVLLSLAREFKNRRVKSDLRFVAFTNEEMPHFRDGTMGSQWHAAQLNQSKRHLIGMISLETMGYFSDQAESQRYPAPLSIFYPSEGNFLAFVGNHASRSLVHDAIRSFRNSQTALPSEGASLPGSIPGVGWSDHAAFWEHGYPAFMVTDTAPFRYPHYHLSSDTPDKIDYHRLAAATDGLVSVISDLVNE